MRILQVAFKNINSLNGEHKIDFTKEPFTYSPIFAITGATGSGKSSILDVISLALYNNIPRMGGISRKVVDSTGAVLTRGQKEAYAKVTYACKKGIFRSEWHISTARTGNLRDYEMYLFDMHSGQALDYKKSQVPTANEQHIGLSYEQFNKSVVLAQGEFAQFLKAPKAERGALLEKITGADIYRKIGIAVYEKNKTLEAATKELKILLASRMEKLQPDDEFIIHLEKQKQLAEKLDLLNREYNLLQEKYKNIQEIKEKKRQLEIAKNHLKQALERAEIFEKEKGSSFKKHHKITPYLSEILKWEQLVRQINKENHREKSLSEIKHKLKAEINSNYREIAKITRKNITEENAIEELEYFKIKYKNLIQQRDGFRNDFKTKLELSAPLLTSLQLEGEIDLKKEQDPSIIEQKRKKLAVDLKALLQDVQLELHQLSDTLLNTEEKKLQSLRNAQLEALELRQLERTSKELSTNILTSKKEFEKLVFQGSNLEEKAKLSQKNFNLLRKEQELERISQSLEEHRKQLEDGKACPLCGALEHPFSAHYPISTSELEDRLKRAQIESETNQRLYLEYKSNLQNLQKTIENEEAKLKENQQKLKNSKSNFKTKFPEIAHPEHFDFIENLKNLESRTQNIKNAIVHSEMLSQYDRLQPLVEELAHIKECGTLINKKIQNLFKGNHFDELYNSIKESHSSNRAKIGSVEDQLKNIRAELDSIKIEIQDIEPRLLAGLKTQGFSSIENAIACRLSDKVYLEWVEENQNIRQSIDRITTEKELFKNDLKLLQQNITLEDEAITPRRIIENQEQSDLLKKEKEDIDFLVRAQYEVQSEIEKIRKEIDQRSKNTHHWTLLNQLIGDSTGNKFNNYAQEMSLTQLLQLANKRLESLKSRYNIDKPLEKEGENLMVIDKDMGNQRRAITTLSGGETFMVSLSLALALSDLAAKNVSIESMFIDEGFGTLDPESLDLTLDALERLQMESSKLIGIISHVDSLKERIATQIQLSQDGKGYSSIKIMG